VVFREVRPYARLELDPGPEPRRRAHLTCNRRIVVDRKKNPCGKRYTLRLDRSAFVARVSAFEGGELVLGVDL
jgi:hypothetical protein